MKVLNAHFSVWQIKRLQLRYYHLLSMNNFFKIENSSFRDLKILAICIFAYAGFLRFREVPMLKRDNIDIQDAYISNAGK